MYGAQTVKIDGWCASAFENDVEMYGAQTTVDDYKLENQFENDVEMYGAQTAYLRRFNDDGLRMM